MVCGAFLDEKFKTILGHSKIEREDWNKVIEIDDMKVIDPLQIDDGLELNIWSITAHSASSFVVLSVSDDDIESSVGHGVFLVKQATILGELFPDTPWWNRFMKNEKFLNSYLYIVREEMNDNDTMRRLSMAHPSTAYLYVKDIDKRKTEEARKIVELDPYYNKLYSDLIL